MSDTPSTPSTPEPEGTDADAPEAPLNRADRRKKARKPVLPGHVGPQADPVRSGRGPRPHSKRAI